MPDSLPSQPEIHFLKGLLKTKWDPTRVVGYDVNATSGESLIKAADSFEKIEAYYPQFTVQMAGDESSPGTTGYSFLSPDGPGKNRTSTLTAQVRVEETENGYTGDSSTYSAVDAEELAKLVRQEIERVCNENPLAPGTEFSFVSAIHSEIPDEANNTRVIRKDGAVISYGWIQD